MISQPKGRFRAKLSVWLAVSGLFSGGLAPAAEVVPASACFSNPAAEAGCAPVVDRPDFGCGDIGCDDLSCDATGDSCCTQKLLLGDPAGLRSGVAESGVSVFFDITQVYQSVAAGGLQ